MSQQVESLVSAVSILHAGISAVTAQNSPHSTGPVRVQIKIFSRQSSCNIGCFCRCHKFTRRESPHLLESLIGKLLVGYSKIPSRSTCNEKRCRPQNYWLLTASYYFPRWFLSHCMISFRDIWSPLEGHSINMRTPRVLKSDSEPVFMAVGHGNMSTLKLLFEQRLASPFDITPLGYDSLLAVIIHIHFYFPAIIPGQTN